MYKLYAGMQLYHGTGPWKILIFIEFSLSYYAFSSRLADVECKHDEGAIGQAYFYIYMHIHFELHFFL